MVFWKPPKPPSETRLREAYLLKNKYGKDIPPGIIGMALMSGIYKKARAADRNVGSYDKWLKSEYKSTVKEEQKRLAPSPAPMPLPGRERELAALSQRRKSRRRGRSANILGGMNYGRSLLR